jgi:hypothetical protein
MNKLIFKCFKNHNLKKEYNFIYPFNSHTYRFYVHLHHYNEKRLLKPLFLWRTYLNSMALFQ